MDSHDALRRAIAAEHRLYLEAQRHEQLADRWLRRAELATRRSEDELARQALDRGAAETRLAAEYRAEYFKQTDVVRQAKRVTSPTVATLPEPSAEDRLNQLALEDRLERDLAALKAQLGVGSR